MSIFPFRLQHTGITLLLLTVVLWISACSHHNPASLLKYSAGETLLIDRVKVQRQRQFLVPSVSRIAWFVESLPETQDGFDKTFHRELVADGLYTFSHVFADVTAVDNMQALPREADFLIKAQLIDARLRVNRTGENNPSPPHRRLLPYTALMKLELLDARSQTPLDVTIIQARSGALGSSQFSHLVRQGLRAYSKSLTHTHKKRY